MRQRKPCRASGFVNGPTDGLLHFCIWAENPKVSRPETTNVLLGCFTFTKYDKKKKKAAHDKLFAVFVYGYIHTVSMLLLAQSCRVAAVCGCHQCPSIPISLDSNKKQGLQSAQIVRM